MPDTYTSQFSGEEIDSALRAAQIISGADTPAELREKLEIYGSNTALSPTDPTPVATALKYRSNPNLLDNWYFGNPVNQRGKTEYTAAGYTVDRWRTGYDGTFTVNVSDTGVSLVSGNDGSWKNFSETIETSKLIVGRTYTFSFLAEDNGGVRQIYISDYGSAFDGDKGLYTLTFVAKKTTRNQDFGIQTNVGKTSIPIAAKLELGDTQTLAHKENGVWVLNEIPDFGEQLRRCTYYAEKVESKDTPAITNSTFVPSGATSAVFILPYARKRTVPAINFNDVSNYRIIARSISGRTTAFSVTAISLLDIGRTKAAILVSFNTTDQGYYCFLQRSDNAAAGYAFISADL